MNATLDEQPFVPLNQKTTMQRNEGTIDRSLRVLLGIALLVLVFTGPETRWGWLGMIPLFTGLVGYCPLYALFGWSTCRHAVRKAT